MQSGPNVMDNKLQHGYLLLADISGYTSYLAGVELDHAHDILTDLLETIVASLKSLLTIGKLEGDAVFAYVPEARVGRGETVIELVEATYLAFRDRQAAVRRRTTCDCKACRAIPSLDLKFIVHHGDYIVQTVAGMAQTMAGIHELVGSDVNLVHRLLKNHVGEATGWRAYALFTAPAMQHLAVPCDPRSLHAHSETYEHLGAIDTLSLDLHARYDVLALERRAVVAPDQADVVRVYAIAAPPVVVWDWLNDPLRRSEWMTGTHWSLIERPGGRTGVGARNHCAHGKNESAREVVLDWKPFEYFTVEQAPDDKVTLLVTSRLEPTHGGEATRLTVTIRLHRPGLPRALERLMARLVYAFGPRGKDGRNLARVVSADYARQLAETAAEPSPAVEPMQQAAP